MIRFLSVFLLLLSCNSFANGDKVAVIVNNKVITEKEIFARKNFIITLQGLNSLGPKDHEYLKIAARQSLIDEILIEEDAKKYRIEASDKDVQNFVKNVETSRKMPNGYFKSKFGTNPELYNSFLKKMKGELIQSRLNNEMFIRQLQVHEREIDDLAIKLGRTDISIELRELSTKDMSDKSYNLIKKIQSSTKTCSQKISDKSVKVENLTKKLSELSKDEIEMIDSIKDGHFTAIGEKDGKLFSFQVCSRKLYSITDQEVNNISNAIGNRRLNLKLVKYIETLRKKAYIKIM
jgi:hypothetical protein